MISQLKRFQLGLYAYWLAAMLASLPAVSGDILLKVEEPQSGATMTGVSNIRGWAISTSGIDRIEMYIDGEYKTDIPQGGRRRDVGADYPQYPDADNSGYSMANNYSLKESGPHVITIRAYDNDGATEEIDVPYHVTRFEDNYINKPSDVDILGTSELSINGPRSLTLRGIDVQGKQQDIRLDWDTPRQNFSIASILPSEQGSSGALDGSYTLSRISLWYGEGPDLPSGLQLDNATASTTLDGISFTMKASGEMAITGSQIVTALQLNITGDGITQNLSAEDESVLLGDLGYAIRYRDSFGDSYDAILLQRGTLLIWMEHYYGDPTVGDGVMVLQWQKTRDSTAQASVAGQLGAPASAPLDSVPYARTAASVAQSVRTILYQADR